MHFMCLITHIKMNLGNLKIFRQVWSKTYFKLRSTVLEIVSHWSLVRWINEIWHRDFGLLLYMDNIKMNEMKYEKFEVVIPIRPGFGMEIDREKVMHYTRMWRIDWWRYGHLYLTWTNNIIPKLRKHLFCTKRCFSIIISNFSSILGS